MSWTVTAGRSQLWNYPTDCCRGRVCTSKPPPFLCRPAPAAQEGGWWRWPAARSQGSRFFRRAALRAENWLLQLSAQPAGVQWLHADCKKASRAGACFSRSIFRGSRSWQCATRSAELASLSYVIPLAFFAPKKRPPPAPQNPPPPELAPEPRSSRRSSELASRPGAAGRRGGAPPAAQSAPQGPGPPPPTLANRGAGLGGSGGRG